MFSQGLADRVILVSKTIENSSKNKLAYGGSRHHVCREISLFKACPRTLTARADYPSDNRQMAPVPDRRYTVFSGNPDVRWLMKAGGKGSCKLITRQPLDREPPDRRPSSISEHPTRLTDTFRYLSDAYVTRGQLSRPNPIGAAPDSLFTVQEGSRYGDTCPAHVLVPLPCTSLPHPLASSLTRPPGHHLIAPMDRS